MKIYKHIFHALFSMLKKSAPLYKLYREREQNPVIIYIKMHKSKTWFNNMHGKPNSMSFFEYPALLSCRHRQCIACIDNTVNGHGFSSVWMGQNLTNSDILSNIISERLKVRYLYQQTRKNTAYT